MYDVSVVTASLEYNAILLVIWCTNMNNMQVHKYVLIWFDIFITLFYARQRQMQT